MRRVIFACVHNAGRSQMAAAWCHALADARHIRAVSAGTSPATRVHPQVVVAMREVGIDLAAAQPQQLTPALLADATHLITMGCGEACPTAPAAIVRDDWPIEDPKGLPLERVRAIRDAIKSRVEQLLAGWQ